jgi:sigma-E factor negative regulatory protein RseC
MATEEGVVIKIGASAGTAWVKTIRSSACDSCSSRHACHAEESGKEMEVEAKNTAGAQVGDRILLNINSACLLKATFLLYIFPVLAMFVGALIGQAVAEKQGMDVSALSALFAFLFFGLAFLLIRIIDRHLSRNASYRPEIIKIRGCHPPPVVDIALPRTDS